MRLAHPWALALIVPAWALAAAVLRRGRAPAMIHPAAASGAGSPSPRTRAARAAPSLLLAGALALAAVALARPQKVRRLPAGEGEGVALVLAVDTSLSMSATDFPPSRLAAAKDLARRFVLGRSEDRIGLVTFGGASLLACPLTADYDALLGRLDGLEPGMTRADGTAIGDGLASAAARLKDSPAKSKAVVLLTDGRSNAGAVDPLTAAAALAALGIKVYAVGTAGRGPALMPVDDPNLGRIMVRTDEDLDEELLAEVARITGGRSWRAADRGQLGEIFAAIDRLEKSALKRPPLVAVADFYPAPLAAAAALLLLESVLAATALLKWP